jgi:hypothetical protein
MAFLICKKCKAGIHTEILTPEMREIMGWPIDGKHRPGECDGDIEIVSDQQAGAGPEYIPPTKPSN